MSSALAGVSPPAGATSFARTARAACLSMYCDISMRKGLHKIMYWVVLACYALSVTVTANDPRPPKVQVADTLRTEISAGVYAAGSRLPSVRDLATRFGVAPNTVQAGIAILQQESLVYSAGNRGTFVGSVETGEDGATSLADQVVSLTSQVRDLATRVAKLEAEDVAHE